MNVKAPLRRRWRFAKPQTPAWVDTLLAVSAAVAAHLLFFGVFDCTTPENTSRKASSTLTLYNISGMPGDVKREAVKWLGLHDPALAVRGDSPIGFASSLPGEKRRRIKVEEFRPQMDVPAVRELKYQQVKRRSVDSGKLPVWVPEAKSAVSRLKAYDQRGREIGLALDMPEEFQPGNNVFAVRGSGDLRRIEILKSLNPDQDQLAVNALLKKELPDGERITVLWLRGEK